MFNSKLVFIITIILLPILILGQEKKKEPKIYMGDGMKKVLGSKSKGKTINKMMTFDAGEVAMLMETSSILTEEEGKTIIKFMPPARAIVKEYQNVDLKTNDKILFINGKKVKKLADFKNIYNEIKIGEEIELGIKRENERFFVKFAKCDPSKLKSKMMMKTIKPDEEK